MTYQFSKRSATKRDECHPDLVRVLNRALSYGVLDFTVLCGSRSTQEQMCAYAEARSHIDGVTEFSKHQIGGNTGRELSDAVDVAPYPIDWKNERKFEILAGIIFVAAAEEGVKLRWGGSWDGRLDKRTNSFEDLVHYEILR